MKRLTDALDFQSQALVLRAERQRLIASNIANADTPGYAAREFDFGDALRNATGAQGSSGGGSGSQHAPQRRRRCRRGSGAGAPSSCRRLEAEGGCSSR